MSRRLLLLLNVVLILVAGALAVRLYQTWNSPRPLPSAKPPAAAGRSAEVAAETPAARLPLDAYAVVAGRNVFSPDRTEVQPPAPPPQSKAAAARPAPRPLLHGVVLQHEGSLAYLEDPRTRRVHGYQVGDLIGDGRVAEILADRVVISRAGERIEVLLRDPSKPKAPPTPTPAATPRAPQLPARPPAPGAPMPVPPAPGQEAEEAEPAPESAR